MSNTKYIGKYNDDSGQWYVAWKDEHGNWHDAGFDTKEQAEKWYSFAKRPEEKLIYKDNLIA